MEYGLIIEVDGDYHLKNEQSNYDETRTIILNELGYKVLRFSNEEVETNLPNVLMRISDSLKSSAPLSSRRGVRGEV